MSAANVPWWDRNSAASHARGLPDPYRTPTQIRANALAAGPVTTGPSDLARGPLHAAGFDHLRAPTTDRRDPDLTDELPQAAAVRRVLDARSFGDFTTLLEQHVESGTTERIGRACTV